MRWTCRRWPRAAWAISIIWPTASRSVVPMRCWLPASSITASTPWSRPNGICGSGGFLCGCEFLLRLEAGPRPYGGKLEKVTTLPGIHSCRCPKLRCSDCYKNIALRDSLMSAGVQKLSRSNFSLQRSGHRRWQAGQRAQQPRQQLALEPAERLRHYRLDQVRPGRGQGVLQRPHELLGRGGAHAVHAHALRELGEVDHRARQVQLRKGLGAHLFGAHTLQLHVEHGIRGVVEDDRD